MQTLETEGILTVLRSRSEEIHRRFAVQRIGIFGSIVRGEGTQASDVDVLVDMSAPTFDRYMDLKFYLEELLGKPVDLVLMDTVKPRLLPHIARDTMYV